MVGMMNICGVRNLARALTNHGRLILIGGVPIDMAYSSMGDIRMAAFLAADPLHRIRSIVGTDQPPSVVKLWRAAASIGCRLSMIGDSAIVLVLVAARAVAAAWEGSGMIVLGPTF